MTVSYKIDEKTKNIIIKNNFIEITFKKIGECYQEYLISYRGYPVAVGRPFSEFAYRSDYNIDFRQKISPDEYRIENTGEEIKLLFSKKETDNDDAEWNFNFEFKLSSEKPYVSLKYMATSNKDRNLIYFSGPHILVGEESFGSLKDFALFPGLEYLLNRDVSSSSINIDEELKFRFSPHPYKITVPLMAVSYNGYAVSLMWDPLQKWDDENSYVSAKFASPNWLEKQDNHLMALFLPSIPKYIPENAAYLNYVSPTYHLKAGSSIKIEAWLTCSYPSSIKTIFNQWFDIFGIPSLPTLPRSVEEALSLCIKTYMDTLWVEDQKGWHMALSDPWGPNANPLICLHLWLRSLKETDESYKNRLRKRALTVYERILKEGLESNIILIDLSLRLGFVEESLRMVEKGIKEILRTQEIDGSWKFKPARKMQRRLGSVGETALGFCALPVYVLLKYARITGDKACMSAGFKGLEYMNLFKRPDDAQTWEVPMHTPDILAAAYAVNAYLEAFKITGDRKYLDKAQYWAYTGLPFVYLWSAEDRPIMKYATIPVFGSTHFKHPWYGNAVQWCGLGYAYAIHQLYKYTQEPLWRKLAEGITIAGIQMQADKVKYKNCLPGMYPDAFSPVSNSYSGWWLNPANNWTLPGNNLATNVMILNGYEVEASSEILSSPSGKIHISSGAQILEATLNGDEIIIKLHYPVNENSYTILAGISKISAIKKDNSKLNEVDNINNVEEGWKYIKEKCFTLIKLKHSAPTITVSIKQ